MKMAPVLKVDEVVERRCGHPVAYDLNTPAYVMHRWVGQDISNYTPANGTKFGDTENFWSRCVGDTLVVRQDRRTLAPHVIQAFCDFCVKVVEPMLERVRFGRPTPMTKEQALAEITPQRWEAYLETWRKEKGIELAESDEDDEVSDEEYGYDDYDI